MSSLDNYSWFYNAVGKFFPEGRHMQELYMRQAIALAEEAAAAGEVPVGCVIVQDGLPQGAVPSGGQQRSNRTEHAQTSSRSR